MSSFGARRSTTKVYLNVYDLAPVNECLHHVGLGMYHTGVEVLGSEYTFAAEAGVFHHGPKEVPQATFREQIYIGEFDGGHTELKLVVDAIGGDQFGPNDYNIINRNCNHFANALCVKLARKSTPAYINRLADIGSCLSCLIPRQFLQQSPVDKQTTDTHQSMPFLMKVPMNRGGGGPVPLPKSTMAFSGAGTVLGGRINNATTSTTSVANKTDNLTDRRDKARAAALARLEIQQPSPPNNNNNNSNNSGSDKSM